jgi:TPR repeat protein
VLLLNFISEFLMDCDVFCLYFNLLLSLHVTGGYEVSQSNAAYLLQRKLSQKSKQFLLGGNLLETVVPSKQLLFLDSPPSGGQVASTADGAGNNNNDDNDTTDPTAPLPPDFADRLLLRELAMSTAQGNANSACSIGTMLLAGRNGDSGSGAGRTLLTDTDSASASDRGGSEETSTVPGPEEEMAAVMEALDKQYSFEKYLPTDYLSGQYDKDALGSSGDGTSKSAIASSGTEEDRNAKAAMMWFSKASAMNSALGSFHAGMLYHFGIGGIAPNSARASRYYAAAISDSVNPLHPSLQAMARTMQWMVDGGSGSGDENASWISRTSNHMMGWIAQKMLL